jgi:DeoR/GlpR family transcriptional regulator of sugar metabolism
MTSRSRHTRLLDAVREAGVASVRELARTLGVSESTVRRDLARLDRSGELTRTYGGAVPARALAHADLADDGTREPPYRQIDDRDRPLKQAVAERAAELVADESVVLLDIGTTTPLIARALRGRPVTVITSNLAVLDELRDDPQARLVLLGGVLRANFQTLVGPLALAALGQVSADLVFLSCTGVRSSGHVVDNMAVEAPIKQAMIEAADRVVLLAHEGKFPGNGSLRLCSLSDVDVLVTTAGADRDVTELCRQAGGKVFYA